jgi:hypothetical protein
MADQTSEVKTPAIEDINAKVAEANDKIRSAAALIIEANRIIGGANAMIGRWLAAHPDAALDELEELAVPEELAECDPDVPDEEAEE